MSRITGGQSKGKLLVNAKHSRPTSGRARTALFSIINDNLPYAMFCDAFAGGGSIGIEALMRGARATIFIEISHSAVRAIQENLRRTGFHHIERDQWQNNDGKTAIVLHGDFFKILKHENKLDPIEILFIDPPWDKIRFQFILDGLQKTKWLGPNCQVILEHNAKTEIKFIDGFQLTDFRKYGDTAFTMFNKFESTQPIESLDSTSNI